MVHSAITEGIDRPNLLMVWSLKRAELAGQIDANQQQLRKLTASFPPYRMGSSATSVRRTSRLAGKKFM
jgi:hypothetical protein